MHTDTTFGGLNIHCQHNLSDVRCESPSLLSAQLDSIHLLLITFVSQSGNKGNCYSSSGCVSTPDRSHIHTQERSEVSDQLNVHVFRSVGGSQSTWRKPTQAGGEHRKAWNILATLVTEKGEP